MLSWDDFNQEEAPAPVAKPKIEQMPSVNEVVQEAIKPAAPVAPVKPASAEPAFESNVDSKDEQTNSDALQQAINDLQSLDIASGLEELEGTANRVAVDDKRMINCRADLNQLVPFKYD
ncbi:MAG: ribonucleotide-diphosphate reductase subunit beta, partial [Gammaproteobacteria bacterium]|nr:ribonucleotide-diphosphate reductase subunit beta [Gammaproteobacteria bacterium]